MKRVLFSMVLLMTVGFTFAQVKNVKEAKSLIEETKPDFQKAQELIGEALTNPETKDDANTWNVAGLIQKRYTEKENEKDEWEILYALSLLRKLKVQGTVKALVSSTARKQNYLT